MRIISGKYRGKKLFEPSDKKTRPLKDLTKESIFNVITHSKKINSSIIDKEILDLFSGSGSFGIECLSREAKFVTFVENYNSVCKILKKNLKNIQSQNFEIIENNILSEKTFQDLERTYDILFLDPPYLFNNLNQLFLYIKKFKILKKNGYGIIHRNSRKSEGFTEHINIVDERNYGISKILFFTLN